MDWSIVLLGVAAGAGNCIGTFTTSRVEGLVVSAYTVISFLVCNPDVMSSSSSSLCPVVGRRSQHAVSRSAWLVPSSVRCCSSSTYLVRLSIVSLVYLWIMSLCKVSRWWYAMFISCLVFCYPRPHLSSDLFSHIYIVFVNRKEPRFTTGCCTVI